MDGEEGIRRAYEAILRSDFEDAVSWFEKAIALDPDNAAYHYKLSITCSRSNRLAKALEHAAHAVRLSPDEPSYLFHLNRLKAKERIAQAQAAVELNGHHLYLAVSLLKEAIVLDPLSFEAYLLMGAAYGGLEEYGPAIQALHEAVKLNPQHEGAEGLLKEYKKRIGEQLGDPKNTNL